MRRNILSSIFLVFALGSLMSCSNNETNNNVDQNDQISTDVVNNPATASDETEDASNLPQMEFEKIVHDFGDIVEGEKVSYSFKFSNTGSSDLLITSATASCGCTVPQYPTDPIAPGDEGTIDVVFDSNKRPGKVDKKVTIIANTIPNTQVIKITGQVKSPVN